jgi:hypothetical protein
MTDKTPEQWAKEHAEHKRERIEGMQARIDPTSYPISGFARAALERGLDGQFSCPLITQIEGNLWNGGCMDGVPLPDDFKFVVSLYPWEKYKLGPDTERIEVTMYDSQDQGFEQVEEIAEAVVKCVEAGKTLVHCQAGLNRSALISATALIKMGRTPAEAISLIREKRSPMCLCNESFENWLGGLGE